jgi:hypothetical protein
MQAIEFETQLNNGMIQLPINYCHWQEGQKVKVIVLGQDDKTIKQTSEKQLVSCLDLIQDDIGIIDNAPADLALSK